jgi:SAM-dependent methyltransferase
VSLLENDTVALDLARWACPIGDADESVLAHAVGPVLDIGCGPGRHVRALVRRGTLAVGLDAAPEAIRLARAHGTHVIQASVFGAVPGAGTWQTALLLDGSVGIGGRPVALLRRVRELLAPGGVVLVEGEPPGTPTRTAQARVHVDGDHGATFPWALVGSDDLPALAHAAGLTATHRWTEAGRWFAALT